MNVEPGSKCGVEVPRERLSDQEGNPAVLSLETTAAIADAVEWADTDEEIILLDARQGLFYGLNGVSAHIWKKLADGRSLNQIIYEMGEEYDTPLETLQNDVTQFVEMLLQKELISLERSANTQ